MGSASLLVLSVFMWDWKRGCGGHFGTINFNKSFLFLINCLETWHIESLHQPRGIWVLAQYFFSFAKSFLFENVFFKTFFPSPENHVSSEGNYVSFFENEKKSLLRSPHFWGLAIPIFEGSLFLTTNMIILVHIFSTISATKYFCCPHFQETFFHLLCHCCNKLFSIFS